ncbi:hypothetical protein [Haliscomenobacter sp.]|uniref:hypothetical protein n=1 Tax=Haliscomenobacter sp. TaxID=2717303 RepID=UPI003BABC708
MKSISKWLVPVFLQRLDQYLRERYPVIWYTGVHWVLFYSLVGAPLLFGAGLLYPVHWATREFVNKKYINLDQWVVDPIKPIEFAYDGLYVYPLLLVVAFACIWMYRQFQNRPFFYHIQQSVVCLLIYAGCCWVLCGITAAAFRMGTIVKTAWLWMPERDLQDFKQSGIYPYGFVFLAKDTTSFIPADTLSFFRKREEVFKRIRDKEGTWLKSRYRTDKVYWEKRFISVNLEFPSAKSFQSYLLNRSDLSTLSDRSDLWYRSFLFDRSISLYWTNQPYRSYLSFRTNQFDQSYLSYLSDRSYLAFLSYLSDQTDKSYVWNLSYLSNRSYWSDQSFLSYRPDLSDLSVLSTYYKVTHNRIKHPKASAYKLINNNDTFYKNNRLVVIPSLPNKIEDAVRCVEHARQFLKEGIFWRYFWHLPYYLFLIGALLLLLPWVSAHNLFQLVIMIFLAWSGLQVFEVEDMDRYEAVWKLIHLITYLAMPLMGLLLLLGMLWQQKQGYLFFAAVNMVFLGVFLILLGALNLGEWDTFYPIGFPIDTAFYGAQLIGLLAACIVPYVQAMPKTR